MRPLDILVVWTNPNFRLRTAYWDLVLAFRRHSGQRCFYWNTSHGPIPERLLKIDYDLIVFNALFMSQKWSPSYFEAACRNVAALKTRDTFKIAMPQDEYVYTDLCAAFLNDFRVNHLCTLAPPVDWPIIYANIDRTRTSIERVLPGYLEPATMARIAPLVRAHEERPLHVGYRAWRAEPWLGRTGLLKGRVADVFAAAAGRAGLPADISVDAEDTIVGDRWYRFLGSCKYTIGVEGGSSVHDPDGALRARTEAFTRAHPQASFEEVETACFPGCDGSIQYAAISPRHLESPSTGTAQILVEGDYNGILKPWVHYIPVRRDLSNADEVLEVSRDESLRRKLVENCRRDLVASGAFTYRHFVQDLLQRIAPRLELRSKSASVQRANAWARRRSDLHQALLYWGLVATRAVARSVLSFARRALGRLRRALRQGWAPRG